MFKNTKPVSTSIIPLRTYSVNENSPSAASDIPNLLSLAFSVLNRLPIENASGQMED